MTRYKVIELDANDKATVLSSGLTQGEARNKLAILRNAYGQHGLRFVMYRESLGSSPKPSYYATVLP